MNVTDCSGDTAKRIAEIYGQVECVKAIEEYKKKESQANDEGESERDEQSPSLKH